jgi:hypothetical protein
MATLYEDMVVHKTKQINETNVKQMFHDFFDRKHPSYMQRV